MRCIWISLRLGQVSPLRIFTFLFTFLALIFSTNSFAPARAFRSSQLIGTATLTRDINLDAAHAQIYNLVNLHGLIYFAADDGVRGLELWKSDGTQAGTTLVKDIQPGAGSSAPGQDFAAGWRRLFFGADDGASGRELWVSDGTAAGTQQVTDLRPGATGSAPYNLFLLNETLYFVADDGIHGFELWKWDFNTYAAVPILLKDINPNASSSNPSLLTAMNRMLYFIANDGVHGYELWKSDGTTAGTTLIKDIRAGVLDSSLNGLTFFNNQLLFSANDGVSGAELWKSDGSTAGTVRVADIWAGSSAGVPNSSSPAALTVLGNRLYFAASDAFSGRELWKSDGTDAGTALVADIWPGETGGTPHSSDPASLTAGWGQLFLVATNPTVGRELFKSDGSASGTVFVKDIHTGEWSPGAPKSSDPANLRFADGFLFFGAYNGVNGVELWHSDGTNFGTSLIQDIWPGELGPGSPNSANPTRLTYGNAALFFIAEEGEHGRELWTLKFPDADGDSLLDSWEANGIDYDHNGTVDLNLAAIGALPGQKDLFVEIDYMVGAGTDNHTPLVIGIQYAALADVAAQFAAHGVTFHFLVDENIGHVMAVNFMGRSPAAMDDFDDLKQTWFGTSAQRAAANAANILGARRLVYRYVIYGHHHNHPPDSSGIAEIGGNDLMVTLGAWDDADLAADGGKRMVESGTFMHEFGHSLVLLHGGGDSINCKPNYFSVMSYAMQLGRFTLRPLDYSGQVLATLNENGGLNEPSGVGGPAGRHTVFGVAGDAHTDAANGALDWNDDGDKTDPNVIADPNHLLRAGCNATPNQTLPGFDDWANLIFNFRMSSDFADGARIFVPVTPELDAAGAGGKAWLPIVPHLP